MQAINLPIRKYRMRILYLRNKKPLTIQKQMVLPWTMSTPIPAWSLIKKGPNEMTVKRDSLLS
jgi:hypothetical protein